MQHFQKDIIELWKATRLMREQISPDAPPPWQAGHCPQGVPTYGLIGSRMKLTNGRCFERNAGLASDGAKAENRSKIAILNQLFIESGLRAMVGDCVTVNLFSSVSVMRFRGVEVDLVLIHGPLPGLVTTEKCDLSLYGF
ncbi:hypothetical protein [Thiobacillus sp.]